MTVPAPESSAAPRRATWRDYVVLTKPKVISLLLMTTLGAMFIAAKGFPGWWPLLGIAIGGYMSAGAAGVFNMIYDRDIDVRMKRTATRPTVTQVIPTRDALVATLDTPGVHAGVVRVVSKPMLTVSPYNHVGFPVSPLSSHVRGFRTLF